MNIEEVKVPRFHNKLDTPRDIGQTAVAGPITFRKACRMLWRNKRKNMPFANFGGNRQNVDKKMRIVWGADKGYKLVQRDQSGADALIVAHLCNDGKYRSLFKHGIKPHSYIALKLFAEEWKKHIEPAIVDKALTLSIEDLSKFEHWKKLNALIKSSDDWPAAKRYYYIGKKVVHACVDKDTEVLTKNGWIKVSDYNGLDQIMVWDKNKECWFEKPRHWHVYQHQGTLIHFNEENLDQLVTDNHRIPFQSNQKFQVRTALELINARGARAYTSGSFKNGDVNLTDDEIKFIAALQADGSFYLKDSVRFHFAKDRKITRMREILINLRVKFDELWVKDGSFLFTVYEVSKYREWLTDKKEFSYKLLTLSRSNLEVLLKELKYWDGYLTRSFNFVSRPMYCSSKESNIDVIKTIAHICNKRGSASDKYNSCYKLSINKRTQARLNWKHPANIVQYDGNIYCPTTSTGFFLIRRNGKISVTGNSSYGMAGNRLQEVILGETEGQLVINKKDADRYINYFKIQEFPEITSWNIRVGIEAEKKKMIRNLFGFPFYITGKLNTNDMKDLIAWGPQSTVAIITEQAVTNMQDYIEDNDRDWHILAETHDSFLVECPESETEECSLKMKEFIEIELTSPVDGVKFTMRSEAMSGYNWSVYSETNPEGLREIQ